VSETTTISFDQLLGCAGKTEHKSIADAERSLKNIKQRGNIKKDKVKRTMLSPYKCHCCEYWHVGAPKREK